MVLDEISAAVELKLQEGSEKRELPVPVPPPSQVPMLRRGVSWIDDDTAAHLDFRETAVAGSLGFFTGGLGHVYNRRWLRGLGMTLGSVGALVASFSLSPLFAVWAAIGVVGAVTAVKDAKTINRFVLARNNAMQANTGAIAGSMASAQNYLPGLAGPLRQAQLPQGNQAPAQAPAGPHQQVIDRLRQLATLRGKDMLNEVEYQDRKIDVLSEFTGADRDDLDRLLYALMPLVEEGTLTKDDIEFTKTLAP
ncbi:MAG: hypothetical protein KJO07_01070 [Deltaproteobacteria bacterium]|nr:hypothetical protein [Deltaproteobacteria bacterium]